MKNQFEQHLKTSLENYKAEYDPAHWEDMQNRLNKTASGKSSSAGKVLGIAAALVAVAGLAYFISTNNSEITSAEKTTSSNIVATPNGVKENNIQKEEEHTDRQETNNQS